MKRNILIILNGLKFRNLRFENRQSEFIVFQIQIFLNEIVDNFFLIINLLR
jgi:hypothetical protein